MATVKVGKSGTFNGKIGDVVLSKWRNLIVARDVPTPSTKPKTVKQLDQEKKFAVVTKFFGPIADLLAIGYQSNGKNTTTFNAAVKDHLETAITGTYPDYKLDYSKVIVSDPKEVNKIDPAFDAAAVAVVGNKVTVTWKVQDLVGENKSLGTDVGYLVFYDVDSGTFVLAKNQGIRSALSTTVYISRSHVGHKLHGYMVFTSADGRYVSESEYLGMVTIIS